MQAAGGTTAGFVVGEVYLQGEGLAPVLGSGGWGVKGEVALVTGQS